MAKQHHIEQPPWRPTVEEPAPFHTGVPPRDIIGEELEAPPDLQDEDAELDATAVDAPRALCVDCDAEIPLERLVAEPEATRCTACEIAYEAGLAR
jgi:hypothetical protein